MHYLNHQYALQNTNYYKENTQTIRLNNKRLAIKKNAFTTNRVTIQKILIIVNSRLYAKKNKMTPNKNENLITNTLEQFAQSFDTKNWADMEACLADSIFIDYSSLRKTKPAIINKADYVAQRKIGLQNLETEHRLSHIKISKNKNHIADCECDFSIKRFKLESKEFFHSYGKYTFQLMEKGSVWTIVKIIQTIDWNEGNSTIHGAFK